MNIKYITIVASIAFAVVNYNYAMEELCEKVMGYLLSMDEPHKKNVAVFKECLNTRPTPELTIQFISAIKNEYELYQQLKTYKNQFPVPQSLEDLFKKRMEIILDFCLINAKHPLYHQEVEQAGLIFDFDCDVQALRKD